MGRRHILHVFPTFGVGGVQIAVVQLVNAMRGKYRHTIVARDGDFGAAAKLEPTPDIALETVPLRKSGFLSFSNMRRARAVLNRIRPDLLVTYNWGTVEWVLGNHPSRICPHIHFESGFGPDESPARQLWRRVIARRMLLAGCRHVVVPSVTLYDIAVRVWHIPARRVIYIPNGVDCHRVGCSPDAAELAALGIPRDVPVVGTVAALRPEKNLSRLLRAFAAVPAELNARLAIIGDGPERARLVETAAGLGISGRVVFVGHVSDPSRVLGAFALFGMTSDTEQMPLAVLEAMAAGLPVVATDVGDTRRMLSEENLPFVVGARDEAALTAGIVRLLSDRALARYVGSANRERARTEYNFESMMARYDALYAEP
ncbi:MAG TPA: glycosyltransferase family 4 protein [Rhizomicrobium sp.]|jgi:glycosyltransferase involved in cell wall biosynthesis|nr:glycosyltransferase family 4 protein [Rhizomicrobium sp.]